MTTIGSLREAEALQRCVRRRPRMPRFPRSLGHRKPLPYHGHFLRVLTGQGIGTADGARNYIGGGRMTNGFALITWPASCGASGIMTFIVNQDGIVFQKDLGPNTAKITAATRLFDPDLGWARVEVVNDWP